MSAFTRHSLIRRGQLSKRFSDHSQGTGPHDERGLLMLGLALAMTVLLSLVTVSIMSGAIGQLQLSSAATNRNGDLEGALAGVQAMVANIRAASASGYVVTNELPCSNVSGLDEYLRQLVLHRIRAVPR